MTNGNNANNNSNSNNNNNNSNFSANNNSNLNNNDQRRIKLVVIGDSYTGKTSMLFAYTKKQFLGNYQTTIFDNYALTINMDQRRYTVNLFDTAGQEDYAHLRVLSYPQTDVFLLCFSLVDAPSLEACRDVWAPEIRRYAGGGGGDGADARIILVGTKEDLMDVDAHRAQRVDLKYAQRIAAEIGCLKFVACSSLTHRGLKRVFDEAILAAIHCGDGAVGGGGAPPNASAKRLAASLFGRNATAAAAPLDRARKGGGFFDCCRPF